jgi:uncharacterized protein (TIGR02246 family)
MRSIAFHVRRPVVFVALLVGALTVCVKAVEPGLPSKTSIDAALDDDETAVRRVFADFARIWDEPGMPGFETLFTEDADFVVITGRWLRGRTEIVGYHRELLRSFYAGSKSLTPTVEAVRFLNPDIAIAHIRSGATYMQDGKEATRRGLATATLVKKDGRWLISAFHNTLTSGPGALAPRPLK